MPDIRRSSRLAGALLLLVLLSSLPACAQKVLWQGESAGFRVEWTSSDIRATNAQKGVVFSAQELAATGFQSFKKDAYNDDAKKTVRDCTYSRLFKIVSLVGPLLSLRDEEDSYCADMPHPSVYIRLTTIDLSASGAVAMQDMHARPGKVSPLTAHFSVAEIWQALAADPVVSRAIDMKPGNPPADAAALAKFFTGKSLTGDEGCEYSFEDDWLTRYSLHHAEDGKIAVRLALPPMYPPCQTTTMQLGLLLAPAAELKAAAADATTGASGFFQKNAPKLKDLELDFNTGKGAEP